MTVPGTLASPLLATAAAASGAAATTERSLRFNPGDSAYLNKTFPPLVTEEHLLTRIGSRSAVKGRHHLITRMSCGQALARQREAALFTEAQAMMQTSCIYLTKSLVQQTARFGLTLAP